VKTVFTLLRDSYENCPERVAIIFQSPEGDTSITFRKLLDRAAAYAFRFDTEGIEPGEPIILLLQHSQALIEGFFGAILHGSIPSIMPFLTEKLSPERYRNSLKSLIQITKPAAIVTYPEFEQEVLKARVEGDSIREVILFNEVEENDLRDWNELKGMNRNPEDIVLLQHSSGTTGLQKGVALSHQAVINQIEAYASAIQMDQEDVVVSWLPLYHDMGLIAGFILPILLRSTLVLMSPFDWVRAPYRLMQSVSAYEGTICWLPNFAYNFCAKKIRDRDIEGVDLSSLRAVINCSEPMRIESHELFYERFREYGLRQEALATCYAMAENVFAVTQGGIEDTTQVDEIDRQAIQEARVARPATVDASKVRMLSAGKPIKDTLIRIINDEGDDLPDRHIGEIAIKGSCLLSGYFNRPDLTEKAFLDDWYRTGDLGYLAEGELFVTGRQKEIIIVGGKNIHPQDLEEIVNEIEGVYPGRVVAFGVFNDDIGTEDIVIVAETTLQETERKADLSRRIRDSIAKSSDVSARYIEVVEREWLVKTSSGKIARGANREKYLEAFKKRKK
jgi:acyl-CoA synthetase (AMP-forming)/AMP-acid ligase II